MIVYLDTSAAFKLIAEEPESAALATWIDDARTRGDEIVSSSLLATELLCASRRRGIDPGPARVVARLCALTDLLAADLRLAGEDSHGLRTADAIHLTAALRLQADSMLVYDAELGAAATDVGLDVIAPTT